MAGERADAVFLVEYEEPITKTPRRLALSFWRRDSSVSLFALDTKRLFLKRTVPPECVRLEDLYISATVTVCARPLKVLGFADAPTERKLGAARGSALLLVKPDAYFEAGKILQLVYNAGIGVGRMRMVRFSAEEAEEFAGAGSGRPDSAAGAGVGASAGGGGGSAAGALTRDVSFAVEVVGDDVLARLHELAGPADPAVAREAAPRSVRALFGRSRAENAVHVSLTPEACARELAFVFDRRYPFTAVATHCSAVIVKPHALASHQCGVVLDALLAAGIEVSAARTLSLSRADAADFLEAYKGVCREFEEWVVELSSGPCFVLEARGDGVVDRVRELAGPYDVAVARELAPASLRARVGVDNVRNALQVTDVAVDGPLEVKFLFSVL